jgi:hypothetical protein
MKDRLIPAVVLIIGVFAGLATASSAHIARRIAPLPVEPTYAEADAKIQSLTMALVSRELSRIPQPPAIVDGLYSPELPADPVAEELRQKLEAARMQRHVLAQTWVESRAAAVVSQRNIEERIRTLAFLIFLVVLIAAIGIQLRRNKATIPAASLASDQIQSPSIRDVAHQAGRAWGHAEHAAKSLTDAFSEGRKTSVKGSPGVRDTSDSAP